MRNECIVCGNSLKNQSILVCKNMPSSAQDLLDATQLNNESGIDLNLCQCSKCGLVQFDCEPVHYYKDVIRAGGYSTTMVELRKAEYTHLIEKYKLFGKKFIEIGCGQGEFLQILSEFPVKTFGIENKIELVDKAKSKGLNVTQNFALDDSVVIYGGPFDVFLSFNFLEHQPFPNKMISCIYNNLVDGGYGLITVPSFEYILEHKSYYELLRDHIAYYTENTLRFLFEKNGFNVLEMSRINRDTIEVIVQKRPQTDISGLLNNFSCLKQEMHNYLTDIIDKKEKIAVWGASHQGFTTISTLEIGKYISYIIDSAPFKQGKYSPASHLKIVSPDYFFGDPVQNILIIAPGYTDEIRWLIGKRYGKSIKVACLKSESIELLN